MIFRPKINILRVEALNAPNLYFASQLLRVVLSNFVRKIARVYSSKESKRHHFSLFPCVRTYIYTSFSMEFERKWTL